VEQTRHEERPLPGWWSVHSTRRPAASATERRYRPRDAVRHVARTRSDRVPDKDRDDIAALRYILPPSRATTTTSGPAWQRSVIGAWVMVNIMSELCRQAGEARALQDLMVSDYYVDRPLFDELLEVFQELHYGRDQSGTGCPGSSGSSPTATTTACRRAWSTGDSSGRSSCPTSRRRLI